MAPRSRARQLDQFYTAPAVAAQCVAWLQDALARMGPATVRTWIEPSAGTGAFSRLLRRAYGARRVIALDLAPAARGIQTQDFLAWAGPADRQTAAARVVVGNPPFGKNAALAVQFVQHAATMADTIAFIVPRTFQKASVQDRLPADLHLVAEHDLPAPAFVFHGAPYAVPCVFQIWQRGPTPRPKQAGALTHPDFVFTTKRAATIAFQRVGVRAGTVSTRFRQKAAASHYFLAVRTPDHPVRDLLSQIDWRPIKERTAGNPSISKRELVAAYAAALAHWQQTRPA